MGNGRKPYDLAAPMLAWLSHHNPTRAQRRALESAGYQVVQVGGENHDFHTGQSAWRGIVTVCRRKPDAIMAVLPKPHLWTLVTLANPIPVIQARMEYVLEEPIWTGHWDRIVGCSQLLRADGRSGIHYKLGFECWDAES